MQLNTMSYTLCISPSCPSCEEILALLKEMEVKIKVRDLQQDEYCEVSIIPALFKGKRLIAYGKDIVRYFKKLKKKRGEIV